jgi:hypothetical protein
MLEGIIDLPNSTRRHQPGMYSTHPKQEPVAQRASRAQRRQEPVTEDDETLLDQLTQDEQPAPTRVRAKKRAAHTGPVYYAPRRQGAHPLFWVAMGMLVLLVGWSSFIHLTGWYINTFADPEAYTQTAHRDMAVVATDAQGHTAQVRAIVDQENHLDLIVIPSGSPDKARMIVGPTLSNFTDPQRAMIQVTAHGTMVTTVAQSALIVDWLTSSRQTAQWSANVVASQPSNKGGK